MSLSICEREYKKGEFGENRQWKNGEWIDRKDQELDESVVKDLMLQSGFIYGLFNNVDLNTGNYGLIKKNGKDKLFFIDMDGYSNQNYDLSFHLFKIMSELPDEQLENFSFSNIQDSGSEIKEYFDSKGLLYKRRHYEYRPFNGIGDNGGQKSPIYLLPLFLFDFEGKEMDNMNKNIMYTIKIPPQIRKDQLPLADLFFSSWEMGANENLKKKIEEIGTDKSKNILYNMETGQKIYNQFMIKFPNIQKQLSEYRKELKKEKEGGEFQTGGYTVDKYGNLYDKEGQKTDKKSQAFDKKYHEYEYDPYCGFCYKPFAKEAGENESEENKIKNGNWTDIFKKNYNENCKSKK